MASRANEAIKATADIEDRELTSHTADEAKSISRSQQTTTTITTTSSSISPTTLQKATDVWKKDVWDFQALSQTFFELQFNLGSEGKDGNHRSSQTWPGTPRRPSPRHPQPPEHFSCRQLPSWHLADQPQQQSHHDLKAERGTWMSHHTMSSSSSF